MRYSPLHYLFFLIVIYCTVQSLRTLEDVARLTEVLELHCNDQHNLFMRVF